MRGSMVDIEQNLALFQELLCCGGNIYLWQYDADGQLLSSNCPHESLFGAAFSFLGCKERALSVGQKGGLPQAVGTTFGLLWGIDFVRRNGELERMYVIGPVSLTMFPNGISRPDSGTMRGMTLRLPGNTVSSMLMKRFPSFSISFSPDIC